MMEYSARPPTIPIPFHKLLKVVALVDAESHEVGGRIERLEAEEFQVEINNGYVRDILAATLALIYPPGIGVVVPGERWDAKAKPMLDYFRAFEESFNRFPGFNYEVQGVYQEQVNGRIQFHAYVVRE